MICMINFVNMAFKPLYAGDELLTLFFQRRNGANIDDKFSNWSVSCTLKDRLRLSNLKRKLKSKIS